MVDFGRLAVQGRAYSAARGWTNEELEALVTFERERKLDRLVAADYVRNGILTLEALDKAIKADFKPKTLEDAADIADTALKDNEYAKPKSRRKTK